MPSGRVVEPNEVYLDGRYYRLLGPVRRSLVSQLPPKVTLGEWNEASNTIASSITWSDLTGGMGQEIMQVGDPPNKVFYADANLSAPRQATLNFILNVDTLSSAASGVDIRDAAPFTSAIILAGSSSIAGATEATTPLVLSFGSGIQRTRQLADNPRQVAIGNLAGQTMCVVPTTSNLDFSTNPMSSGTWNRNTTDISYVSFWRDLLWGVNSSARTLHFTADLTGAWTQVAGFSSTITPYGLLVGPAADGSEVLYLISDRGLYLYDSENERFLETALIRPISVHDGKIASARWRDRIYIANRSIVYEFMPGFPSQINVLSPFPQATTSLFDVPFRSLIGNFHSLWALAASTGAQDGNPLQTIYKYNGQIWEMPVRSISQSVRFGLLVFGLTNSFSQELYTLGFSTGSGVRGLIYVPIDVARPGTGSVYGIDYSENTGKEYIVLPWLVKDGTQDWLALEVLLSNISPNSSNLVQVEYGLNFDSSTWTVLGSNSTTGDKTFPFPVTGDQIGTAFTAIRFRLLLAGDGLVIIQRTPIFNKLTLSYLRKPRTLWGFDVVLDLKESYKAYTPQEQREALESVVGSTPLVEFTYKSGSFFVTALAPESLEDPQKDYTTYRLRLVEAI